MTPITEVEGRRLALSNLDKVLYPATGTTKGEVLHYYAATAAEAMLPHLRDRPLSFLRYPDGPEGLRFFTKNPPPGTPDWVRTAPVPRSDDPGARQVLAQDLPSLMWAANLVVEFHTHQWRQDSPGVADRMVFDLDPGPPASVVECCAVALWLRDRLAADELSSYGKTSGSKGLHLLVPLEPTPSEDVTAFAKRLAMEAQDALPELVVHRMTRALRPGKVFVDFSQNAAAKTTAAPYTLRAKESPTVSAPVTWDEIEACGKQDDLVFLAGDMAARLERYGDLLAPLTDPDQARPLPGG
ncbi:non-homologous end-joining DNA ligase [Streptomyces sp. NE06-03E]|uniref:ATP-dependent DNA ligase n=2 Tax=Streptomyces TaxID=1883 RepID=A0A652KUH2_9ACTN|nr:MULTISPECIES: non-homologous end-joining DNA ligase [unclassified Streptomyces]WSS64216.1 non-homologous end-joining DNA ligase [Streptomyces sp. NBC_01177]WSS71209.1 non-homologous end-joining DNA ligase [Streptomyces sp. NBC_01175]WSS78217.1 non-homologous end-joining DNA ligase [Streptomyces sp. NBC_01174]MDX3055622.1 non-homologous end-joining DNA ligase [Streptomyces sp. NE06-03E]MDX3324577.1 non-homologous end-joining DNA ligase [Streptomyces sp. ME02-6979-3A]